MEIDWHDAWRIALAVSMEQSLTLPRVLIDPFFGAHSLSEYYCDIYLHLPR